MVEENIVITRSMTKKMRNQERVQFSLSARRQFSLLDPMLSEEQAAAEREKNEITQHITDLANDYWPQFKKVVATKKAVLIAAEKLQECRDAYVQAVDELCTEYKKEVSLQQLFPDDYALASVTNSDQEGN